MGLLHISISKTAYKEIGALIRFMKFLSPEVALCLYKSIIWPYMEYFCHIWVGAPSCYLELLVKLQKWICRTFDPSLGASLEHLAHCQNAASLSLFYRYCFGICLSELVPLPYSRGRSTCYFDWLLDSLPIECLPLDYDLNGFNFRININLLTVGSF